MAQQASWNLLIGKAQPRTRGETTLCWGEEQTLSRGSKEPTRDPKPTPTVKWACSPNSRRALKPQTQKTEEEEPGSPGSAHAQAPETRAPETPSGRLRNHFREPHPPQVPQPAGPPAMKTHTALGSQFTTLIEYSN